MHSSEPHDLTAVSTHHTSEGVVSYFRCACGAWEVRTADHLSLAITSSAARSPSVAPPFMKPWKS